jgi:hypothetical protein
MKRVASELDALEEGCPIENSYFCRAGCEVCFPSTPGKSEILNQSDLFLDLVQLTGGFDAESMKAFFLCEKKA